MKDYLTLLLTLGAFTILQAAVKPVPQPDSTRCDTIYVEKWYKDDSPDQILSKALRKAKGRKHRKQG